MSAKPIALILGAGPNAGTAIASSLSSLGYRIATASRSASTSLPTSDTLALTADFTNPSSIPPLFTRIHTDLHAYPSVVVYNAATLTPPLDAGVVTSVPVDKFAADLNVNVVSPYVAAQEAVKGWKKMGQEEGGEKTFIFTGNMLNRTILPVDALVTLGVGKSASAYWVGLADEIHKGEGYRFFYTDQRQPDGSPMGNVVDGPAHGEFYAQLVQRTNEVPWLATFVKGKGHVKFDA
ncbi:hypothetical protein COCMIDRAFT_108040 [Bipolaris oryzae ATCC 44560]|uniref:NAD(P)-binding domain-containing protein n=1 Tax=Bipolaris oryzae ATCC 44560 TaxID=930090 RepID=W6YT18_COCMI|nr:uncharacterized protein COCMIDRAFT_108040 [Bipolaris oryzae ATCC 44560]EUC40725.1 hypothetical protein COCMIDRAFT_108040 [Bipolaris oryzae ATCC 44560]